MLLRAACRRPPCEHQPTLRSEAGPVATPDSIGLDASLKVRKDTVKIQTLQGSLSHILTCLDEGV